MRGNWDDLFPEQRRGLDSPAPRDAAQVDRARRAYYAQLTFIDHQINRLTHALHEHEVLDNTVILFCGDHGDMLYDHGLTAKALPYEASANIPFILRLPRSCGVSPDQTLEAPVELRDILPTLCELAGIDTPDHVEGRSLVPLCNGGAQPSWREYVHGEHALGPFSNQWITDGRWKYAWYSQSGTEQLFDLQSDPNECTDLSESHPAEVTRERQRLIAELEGREEGFVQNGRLVPGQSPKAVLSHILPHSEET